MKTFNIIAVTVFLGVVGFIAFNLIKDSDRKFYVTTLAEIATIEEKFYISGYVYPSKEIDVKPQISGVVDTVYVDIGDQVKEGDPIASISLVPNSSEVEQLTSAVNLARINLASAKNFYERQKQLMEKKAISKTDFEASEKEYLTAKENYSTSTAQLALRQKSNKAANNIVRSSTDGVIIDIPVSVGTSVVERSNFNAGSTVATIAGSDHYTFRANIPEKNIGSLYTGIPVHLSLHAYRDAVIEAFITKISAKGEIQGGTVRFPVEAEFSLNNNAIYLRSGFSATAKILLSKTEDALAIPEKCLNFKGDTIFVYVTDSLKRTAREKMVSIGVSDGEIVQITEGISNKDLIITNYHD